MKVITKLTNGLILKLAAAPCVLTGRASQSTAKGLVVVSMTTSAFGENAELKGLKLAQAAEQQMSEAMAELAQTREQRKAMRAMRKAERESTRKAKAEQAKLARAMRIKELEMSVALRRHLTLVGPEGLQQMLQTMQSPAIEA